MLSPLLLLGALLRGNGLDAGDVAAGFTQPRGVLQLSGGALKTQVEAFLLQIEDGVLHLIGAHCADVLDFHLGHDHFLTPRCARRSASGSAVWRRPAIALLSRSARSRRRLRKSRGRASPAPPTVQAC